MFARGISYFVSISALIATAACSPVNFNTTQASSTLGTPGTTGLGTPTSPSPTPAPIVQLSSYLNAVAWEDLYGVASPDFDYNDFVTDFQITERYTTVNSVKQITDIYIDFFPRAAGAGDDSTMLLVLGKAKTTPSKNQAELIVTKTTMFNGSAAVTLSYYDQNGNPVGNVTTPSYASDITVFQSTHAIFQDGSLSLPTDQTAGGFPVINTVAGQTYYTAQLNARVHIALDNPAANPYTTGQIDPANFRVVLHNNNTNYDIDIINVDRSNYAASTGYPWGFIIPTSWSWMREGDLIDNGYPEFSQYRKFLLGETGTGDYMNWFLSPSTTPADGSNPALNSAAIYSAPAFTPPKLPAIPQ